MEPHSFRPVKELCGSSSWNSKALGTSDPQLEGRMLVRAISEWLLASLTLPETRGLSSGVLGTSQGPFKRRIHTKYECSGANKSVSDYRIYAKISRKLERLPKVLRMVSPNRDPWSLQGLNKIRQKAFIFPQSRLLCCMSQKIIHLIVLALVKSGWQ